MFLQVEISFLYPCILFILLKGEPIYPNRQPIKGSHLNTAKFDPQIQAISGTYRAGIQPIQAIRNNQYLNLGYVGYIFDSNRILVGFTGYSFGFDCDFTRIVRQVPVHLS